MSIGQGFTFIVASAYLLSLLFSVKEIAMDNDKLRTNHWPQPPFPDQPQTPPGTAAEMEPTGSW